ncbi:MAG: hypothetical protein ACOYVD_05390 [Bacillota bacterium]
MIQIDDAGSGSLIGGTGIGILNTKTGGYYFEVIPLKFYQTDLFEKKIYQDYVINIVIKAFSKLEVKSTEKIQVCQGYMFDKLRLWLDENKYSWDSTKIEGSLQNMVEESFNQYVINLGLPEAFIKHARYAFGFHRLLKWVFADISNRKKLCKTQWKSWQKWGNIDKSIYYNNLSYPDYCLKCGKKMRPSTKVVTIEYMTNKPATINMHNKCYSGRLNPYPPTFLHNFTIFIKVKKYSLNDLQINQDLLLQNIDNNIHVLDLRNRPIGLLNNWYGEKLKFWLDCGFSWSCRIEEISDNKIQLGLLINKDKAIQKDFAVN